MKTYTRLNNVGKAKYTVSFHDGIKKHKDGSPFDDLMVFKNKKALKSFIGKLVSENYVEN